MAYGRTARALAGSVLLLGAGAQAAQAAETTGSTGPGPVCGAVDSLGVGEDRVHLDLGEDQPRYDSWADDSAQQVCGGVDSAVPLPAPHGADTPIPPILGGLPLR